MAAGIYNFTIEQGATFTRQFKYKDANGTAIDLITESHTARMDIRTSIGGDLISSFSTVGSGLSISSPNIISLTIPAEDTASYTFNNVGDISKSQLTVSNTIFTDVISASSVVFE